MEIFFHFPYGHNFLFLLWKNLEGKMSSHMVTQCLTFWETAIQAVFHSDCTICHTHHHCDGSNFSTYLPTPVIVCPFLKLFKLIFWEGETERKGEREKTFIFVGWFLYVPWSWMKTTTLAHQDDAPAKWATQPEHLSFWSYIS